MFGFDFEGFLARATTVVGLATIIGLIAMLGCVLWTIAVFVRSTTC